MQHRRKVREDSENDDEEDYDYDEDYDEDEDYEGKTKMETVGE